MQKETKAKIIVFTIPYLGTPEIILPPYDSLLDIRIREYNSIIEKAGLENNLTVIDLYSPTKEYFTKTSDFYSSDQFHPSENGYVLWGTLINNLKF